MGRPEDYEGHAVDCVALADGAIRFPDSKAVLLEMAEAWFKLAQCARERKNEKSKRIGKVASVGGMRASN